jgi:RimJ/RimL family protein N-acetyltransferase
MVDLTAWQGAHEPQRIGLDGRYARLEPLDVARHESDLFEAAAAPGAEARFRYLFDDPPTDRNAFHTWMTKAAASTDPLYSAVIDKRTGRTEGRQALMRIVPAHGVIEIGSILWGPAIARSRIATEALFLMAEYVFERLGYRRFEWKCNALNVPSRHAALRFGFCYEGTFRQHMVVKGKSRDTAWFAMTDGDWATRKAAYLAWLAPANFDETGTQKSRLNVAHHSRWSQSRSL